ncbi:MAG TPA: type II toxin-antitoxin system RelB/DinJ family antitoxin [Candidatus Yonathbacteria bacterium]|nr:type II toxin-antitoxin system RelB/DinJ family antitoxin [Candidatus Yonathbacteria bacterium]
MKTVLNIKTDVEVKKQAQKIAKDIGLPLSTVVNAYLKEFIQDKRVTFSAEPKLRPEVEKILRQASKDYKEGKNMHGPFDNVKDLMKSLNS